ncbi:MAG: hypothetical protein ACYTGX_10015 [Planctomycetota bacterium]|jgi:hypothetical protein
MRRFVIAAAVSLLPVAVSAQEMEPAAPAKDVAIRPNWKAGMRVKLRRVREKRETNRAGVTKATVTNTLITVVVTEVQEERILLDWIYGSTTVTVDGAEPGPFVQAAHNLLEGATAKVVIDDLAEPKAITNGAALLAHAQQGIEELEVKHELRGPMRQALNQLRGQVRDARQLTGKILAEIRLLLMCSGGDYPPGEPLAYDELIPQPFGFQFGRAKLKTAIRFTLAKPAPAAAEHTVTFTTRLDATAARPVLFKAYTETAERRGVPVPEDDTALGELAFQDDAVFVLDAKTGFPRSLEHTRVVKIGGTERTETNRVSLVPSSR